MRSITVRVMTRLLAPPHWHNVFLILLALGLVADLLVGLDEVLNAVSVGIVVGLSLVLVGLFAIGVGGLVWITVRDALEATSSDRREGRAWRWRIPAYLGILGILIDGVAGTWHAFEQHILFSTAIEKMPLAGLPIWLLLLSYPVKWIEQGSYPKGS